MKAQEIVHAWGKILRGERPLRCLGCYAYEDDHPSKNMNLRRLSDFKSDELVRRALALVDELWPLHLSIVGGDPLVRYRELDVLLPQLSAKGIHTQIVTNAFCEIPASWASIPRVYMVVSIDGLQSEHDMRRRPAAYERIIKNIAASSVTLHCTITAPMMQRQRYLEDFLQFWTPRPEVRKVWISIFTPQKDAKNPEILSSDARCKAVHEMLRLRKLYPKLDMSEGLIREFLRPPASP